MDSWINLKIFLFLIALIPKLCFSQDIKLRLVNEIKNYNHIESRCLGYSCNESLLFKKADTLNSFTTLDEKIQLMNDSSYVLKYYIFNGILDSNDSIAFIILKSYSSDTTLLSYQMNCVSSGEKFNQLLGEEYIHFITMKYNVGGSQFSDKVYNFPLANKKKFRMKYKEYQLLPIQNNSQYKNK